MTGPRIIAEFNDYDSLRTALRMRWEERGYALEDAAEKIGLPARFLSKVFGPNPSKRLTMDTFGLVMMGFGLKCQVVEDPQAIERFERLLRRANPVEALKAKAKVHLVVTNKHLRKIGRKGGLNSRKRMTAKQASELGRRSILIRWADVKAAAALAAAAPRSAESPRRPRSAGTGAAKGRAPRQSNGVNECQR